MAGISGFGNNNYNNYNQKNLSVNNNLNLKNANTSYGKVLNVGDKVNTDGFVKTGGNNLSVGDQPQRTEMKASWGGFWGAFVAGWDRAAGDNKTWEQYKNYIPNAQAQNAGSLGCLIEQFIEGCRSGIEYLRGEGR